LSDWDLPPADDEIEVAVFGPGKGEALVVHLGRGEWMAIDSCVDDDGNAAALAHLSRLGVSPEQIVLIIASHWHDDHIGGMAQLVAAAKRAQFVCSQALQHDEFLALVASGDQRPMLEGTSGVHEFALVLETLSEGEAAPAWAGSDRRLLQRADPVGCEVWSLSPSDTAISKMFDMVGQLLEDQRVPDRRAVPRPKRNPAATVISARVGAVSLLFGADLECSTDPTDGWTAILDSGGRPAEPADLFKVAHHGSVNAHDDRVWTEMLGQGATAVLTPYTSGKTPLPRATDVERLVALTPEVWITRTPGTAGKLKRNWTVDKTIESATKWIRKADADAGSLRLRRKADGEGDWSVDATGAAGRLLGPVD
jgi:hypothetical protein